MLSSLNNILRASVRLVGLLCGTLRADFVAFSSQKIIDVTYPVADRIHCTANCIVFSSILCAHRASTSTACSSDTYWYQTYGLRPQKMGQTQKLEILERTRQPSQAKIRPWEKQKHEAGLKTPWPFSTKPAWRFFNHCIKIMLKSEYLHGNKCFVT